MPYEWPLNPTLEQRFWPKVEVRADDECWPWLAFRNPAGYGTIKNFWGSSLAHRICWVLHHGGPIEGKHVLHTCDNPACVNPAHLYLGTNEDNIADKVARGRSHAPQPNKQGEKHPLAKLTDDDARLIHQLANSGRRNGRELARRFGVSPATICNIKKGKTWKAIT